MSNSNSPHDPSFPDPGSTVAGSAGPSSAGAGSAGAGSTELEAADSAGTAGPADTAGAAGAADAPDTSLESKLRRARILNIVLAAVSAFLLLVTIAQISTGAGTKNLADGTSQTGTASTGAGSPSASEGLDRRDPQDPMALGPVDAPVAMVAWTDLRCPFCALFSRETLPTLVSEYVQAGQLRIEFRDVAFFGDESAQAAVAARAAGNQGRYTEYLDAVFQAAPESGHPDLPREQLIGFAEEVNVADLDRFIADLDDPTLLAEVQQGTSEAQQLGVNSVPFFAIGTTAMSGAQPVDSFRRFIDGALAEAE